MFRYVDWDAQGRKVIKIAPHFSNWVEDTSPRGWLAAFWLDGVPAFVRRQYILPEDLPKLPALPAEPRQRLFLG